MRGENYRTKPKIYLLFLLTLVLLSMFTFASPAVALTGEVIKYGMDEGSGTLLQDGSGQGNCGMISGAQYIPGLEGYGLQFDGVDDCVSMPYVGGKPANSFTLEAWVKAAATHEIDPESTSGVTGTSGQKYLFGAKYAGDNAGVGVSVGTNGISVYEHGGNYMPALAVYAGNVGTGWVHIVVTYENKVPRIYLNGALVKTGLTSPKAVSYAPIELGSGSYGAFNGAVDRVIIYNRTLTAAEVLSQYYQIDPGAFNLIAPAAGVAGVSLTPTLTWEASPGAASYDVHYYVTPPYPPVTPQANVTGTSFTITNPLAANTTYHWYVVAKNTKGQRIANNTPRSFTTEISSTIKYEMDEGSGATLQDGSGQGNHGAIYGAQWTTGRVGSGLQFNGLENYVDMPYAGGKPANNFTLEAWAKTSAIHEIDQQSTSGGLGTSGQCYLFGANQEGSNAGVGVSVGTNGISVYEHGSGYMPALAVYAGSVGTGWVHIVVTYENKLPRIYLNGALVKTGLTSPRPTSYAPTRLGSGAYGGFNGAVDKVRIYNRTLTAAEVAAQYNQTAPGSFNLTAPAAGATGVSLAPTLAWEASAGAVSYDVYYGPSLPATPTANVAGTSLNIPVPLAGNTAYQWKVVAKNTGGEAVAANTPRSFTTGNESVVRYNLDEGSGPYVQDGSGQGNHTSIYGAQWTTGKFGSGLHFDGADDYVAIPYAGGKPANNFTLEAWVKAVETHLIDPESTSGTGGTSGQKYLFGANQEGDNGGVGISVGTNGISVYEHGSFYMPALAVYVGDVGTDWVHIVVTYENKRPRIYLNGALVKTGLTSLKPASYAPIRLGSGDYGGFNGTVDNVAIYDRTLSAAEVSARCNQSAPGSFNLTAPAAGATGISINPTLSWQASAGADSYEVYYGETLPATPQAVVTGTSYSISSALPYNTAYQWKIVAGNIAGKTAAAGAPRSFTTQVGVPEAFDLLMPGNGATGVSVTPTLSWEVSANATSYDVYYGETLPAYPVASVTGTSYAITTALTRNTTYYWKVVARSASGLKESNNSPFSFTPSVGIDPSVPVTTVHYYDAQGHEIKTNYTIGGATYTVESTYDGIGRPTDVTYPDQAHSKVYYTYRESNGQTAKIGSTPGGDQYFKSASYDQYGMLTNMTVGNNVTINYTYNPSNLRLTNVHALNAGSQTVQNISYTYENAGLITGIADNKNSYNWTYSYDDSYRLTGARRGTGTTPGAGTEIYNKSYSYNNIGNITSFEGTSYTYGSAAHKHAVTAAGSNTYTYDANGNMTSGAGRTVTWNCDNTPATITKAGVTTNFHYGAGGNRVIKTAGSNWTAYVNNYEIDQDGNEVLYLDAGGVTVKKKSDGTLFFILKNHLGGQSVITNAAGNEVTRQYYQPYGLDDPTGALTGETDDYKFTGQELDSETGLYNYNARLYDPALGRFISADPLVGTNRYLYCGNNPLNFIDPSGYNNFMVRDHETGKQWSNDKADISKYKIIEDINKGGNAEPISWWDKAVDYANDPQEIQNRYDALNGFFDGVGENLQYIYNELNSPRESTIPDLTPEQRENFAWIAYLRDTKADFEEMSYTDIAWETGETCVGLYGWSYFGKKTFAEGVSRWVQLDNIGTALISITATLNDGGSVKDAFDVGGAFGAFSAGKNEVLTMLRAYAKNNLSSYGAYLLFSGFGSYGINVGGKTGRDYLVLGKDDTLNTHLFNSGVEQGIVTGLDAAAYYIKPLRPIISLINKRNPNAAWSGTIANILWGSKVLGVDLPYLNPWSFSFP